MNEKNREQLSALVDDELSAHEQNAALRHLSADDEQLKTWDHYNLIGDAIRGEHTRLKPMGISQAVHDQIALEPAILSPNALHKPMSTWVKPAVGTAIAASVAVMAILVAPKLLNTNVSDQPTLVEQKTISISPSTFQSTVVAARPLSEGFGVATVSTERVHPISLAKTAKLSPEQRYAEKRGTRWNRIKPAVENRLNSFLVNHQEYAPASAMTGMLPYAAFVGYDTSK